MTKQPNRVGGLLESIEHYPEHLRLIGLIITETARAEGTLALTFWALVDDPSRADAVFWTLGSAKARTDVVRGVAMETLTGDGTPQLIRSEVLSSIDDFRNAASRRNDIAHGQWGTPAQKGANPFLSIKRPATKNPIFEKVYSTQDLEAVLSEIRNAERRLDKVNSALNYYLRPDDRAHLDSIWSRFAGTDAYFRKLGL